MKGDLDVEALASGFANGLQFGLAPELEAAVRPGERLVESVDELVRVPAEDDVDVLGGSCRQAQAEFHGDPALDEEPGPVVSADAVQGADQREDRKPPPDTVHCDAAAAAVLVDKPFEMAALLWRPFRRLVVV